MCIYMDAYTIGRTESVLVCLQVLISILCGI